MEKIMMVKKKKNVFKTSLSKCIEMQDLHEFFFIRIYIFNNFYNFIRVNFGKYSKMKFQSFH
jgi:hypothetical protein